MSLRARIVLGLVAIAAILLIPFGYALRSIENLHDTTRALRDREFAASFLLGAFREVTEDLDRSEDALLFLHDVPSSQRMENTLKRVEVMADSLRIYGLAPTGQAISAATTRTRSAAGAELAAASAGRATTAEAISVEQTRPAIAEIKRAISVGEVTLRNRTVARVDTATIYADRAQRVGLGSLGFAILFAALLAYWLARSVSRPVYELDRGMRAVAEGDFSVPLEYSSKRKDEFGRLSASYASMATQLAELDRVRAEFISVASHELKTPINVILGYVELIQEKVYGEINPKQEEVLGTVIKQANSLTRLVKRLLDISRFEASGGKLDTRDIHLPRFLTNMESSFRVLAHQRGIEFSICHAPDLPETVHWDEDRMNEVVGNLLSNAFKFTPRAGSVILEVERVKKSVRITVGDTGAGIDPEQLQHVFQKFFQADNQAQAAVKGTGLGLAIAKEIVDAHDGTIGVESTRGTGSKFTVVLPISVESKRRPVVSHS
ncbi:MAG: HAMP domain-containing histidine kinase [Gemmatimonadaceae bacterium]|nr:HAMP domain-containing histidine kinase [Gemmatimonadaceae bacterium]